MKRIDQSVAGFSGAGGVTSSLSRRVTPGGSGLRAGEMRRDVAGIRAEAEWEEVASFHHAMRQSSLGPVLRNSAGKASRAFADPTDPTGAFAEDAMLLEELADFIGTKDPREGDPAKSMLKADREFRERLRGRLWRTFVRTYLRNGEEPH